MLNFTKMHGLGNDFIVIDAVTQKFNLSPQQIAALSRRDTGVGFDQCLVIESPRDASYDFFYRIFNADGSEVGQCGNGARCLARFVSYYGLTQKNTLSVATTTTRMQLQINADNTVTIALETPKRAQKNIIIPNENDQNYTVHAIDVGNPHAVMPVANLIDASVQQTGKFISEHAFFPNQTNVGFMQIISPEQIKLRVYERGVGETRACGSGAVAAMAIGKLYHQLANQVKVSLPGGDLLVSWSDIGAPIFLTGPAEFVYEGRLKIF